MKIKYTAIIILLLLLAAIALAAAYVSRRFAAGGKTPSTPDQLIQQSSQPFKEPAAGRKVVVGAEVITENQAQFLQISLSSAVPVKLTAITLEAVIKPAAGQITASGDLTAPPAWEKQGWMILHQKAVPQGGGVKIEFSAAYTKGGAYALNQSQVIAKLPLTAPPSAKLTVSLDQTVTQFLAEDAVTAIPADVQ